MECAHRRQEAEQRLHLVPGQGIADERHRRTPDELEEPPRVETGELAVVRPPPPPEEVHVRPAVLDAILVVLDHAATGVGVVVVVVISCR